MIVIYSGLPGSGKSLKLAQTILDVMYRNQKIFQKQLRTLSKESGLSFESLFKQGIEPVRRKVYINLKMSPEVEQHFAGFFEYWSDLRQLTVLRDVDVFIDEVATYFDSRLWETLSLEMRRWLAQHRKFGIEIYGTTQDFAQVDKAFRRLTSNLLHLQKLGGSGDISPTKPAPRFIWGLVLVKELDPTVYDELKSKFQGAGAIPRFMIINRARTSVFDTRAEIAMSKALAMKHINRVCELPTCTVTKIQHV